MQPYPFHQLEKFDVGRFDIELGELETDRGPSPYSIIHMRPFACCAPFVNGHLAMVRQYRYSVGAYQLELPAGGVDGEESPREAAIRELREETGLVAREVLDLGMLYTSVGSTNEECHIFAATCDEQRTERDFDSGEQIDLVLLTRKEAEQMIDEGSMVYPAFYVVWTKLARCGLLDSLLYA